MTTLKGFEYRIDKAENHLFITNKVGKEIVFKFGTYNGKPVESQMISDGQEVSISEKQFVQLVERLAFEADKIINRLEKKEQKATLDFGDEKPKKKKGDPA